MVRSLPLFFLLQGAELRCTSSSSIFARPFILDLRPFILDLGSLSALT